MNFLKGWGLKLMAGAFAVAGFLAMWLRLKYAQEKMEDYRREAKSRAEKATVSKDARDAARQVREEAKTHEREEADRHSKRERPTGSFGDRLRR